MAAEIIPGKLYLGGKPNARYSNEIFKHRNITLIVNTTTEVPNFEGDGWNVIRIPLEDTLQQNLYQHFEYVCDLIDKNEGATFIHCYGGQYRSVTFCIAYLMKKHGWKYKDAKYYVQERRPIAYTKDPRYGAVQLMKYYNDLHDTGDYDGFRYVIRRKHASRCGLLA